MSVKGCGEGHWWMGVCLPRAPHPSYKKRKIFSYFLKRQGLRRGVVVDGRMPAPPPPAPNPPLLQQKISHHYFQKRLAANTVEE